MKAKDAKVSYRHRSASNFWILTAKPQAGAPAKIEQQIGRLKLWLTIHPRQTISTLDERSEDFSLASFYRMRDASMLYVAGCEPFLGTCGFC